MSSQWVEQYVQQRINEARRELEASKRPTINKQVGGNSSFVSDIAGNVGSRVLEQKQQQAGDYTVRPESSKPGFQGMYSDELFRRSGFYADEWARLHGHTVERA